jgi:hypothetical protein
MAVQTLNVSGGEAGAKANKQEPLVWGGSDRRAIPVHKTSSVSKGPVADPVLEGRPAGPLLFFGF